MGVASSQRIKLGTQGSEGGCQCILRLGTPGTQTADDLGESERAWMRQAGFSFSNTDIEICIAPVRVSLDGCYTGLGGMGSIKL